jgi:hypothetical protein
MNICLPATSSEDGSRSSFQKYCPPFFFGILDDGQSSEARMEEGGRGQDRLAGTTGSRTGGIINALFQGIEK